MSKTKIFFTLVAAIVLVSFFTTFESVYGHGLGLDTISSIDVGDQSFSVSIEMPSFFTESDKQISITAVDEETKENVPNVTFLIGLFHEDEMIFRNYFLAPEGNLLINVNARGDEIEIIGEQDPFIGAWYATESQPLEISAPAFASGGLFHFEIEIRAFNEKTNIVENLGVYTADVSVAETTNHFEEDLEGNEVKFRIKSYFDKISEFEYNPEEKLVTFSIPFDWSEKTISHIPVVHEEVHFPKDFSEFLSPGYVGKVNGIELFKSSVTIDDYTEEDERIVHFVLLQDHLRFLKNQMKKSGEPLPDKMVFTLNTTEKIDFPLTAYTSSEDFLVNLSWDPVTIEPETNTKFVFTIRDGQTGEPLRNSDYTFVILQGGQEIHRVTGFAQVGGESEDYYFTEDQTGPTIIRFENIRNSGQETEFGIVVAPEFGVFVTLILVVSLIGVILISRKSMFSIKQF